MTAVYLDTGGKLGIEDASVRKVDQKFSGDEPVRLAIGGSVLDGSQHVPSCEAGG